MDHFQYIPFDIPDYLAQYFATKINCAISQEGEHSVISVNRSSYLGKSILKSITATAVPARRKRSAKYLLKVSNFSGDHFPQTPRGHQHFLDISPEAAQIIVDAIKMDFDDALVTFVEGAEFAHVQNGWRPNQRRKGIRKHAILEFCNKHDVSPDQKNLQALFKMYQRRQNSSEALSLRSMKKLCVFLSL